MNSTLNLKPCRLCGGVPEVRFERFETLEGKDALGYVARCRTCGRETALYYTETALMAEWNGVDDGRDLRR